MHNYTKSCIRILFRIRVYILFQLFVINYFGLLNTSLVFEIPTIRLTIVLMNMLLNSNTHHFIITCVYFVVYLLVLRIKMFAFIYFINGSEVQELLLLVADPSTDFEM